MRFTVTLTRSYVESIQCEIDAASLPEAIESAYAQEDSIDFDWDRVTDCEKAIRAVDDSAGHRVYPPDEAAAEPGT